MRASELEQLTRDILRLRYGHEDATRSDKPLFSVTCVAKYLHRSHALVTSVLGKYFRQLESTEPKRRHAATPAWKIAEHATQARLATQVTKSLAVQAEEFNRANPDYHTDRWELGKIYRRLGISKKKVVKQKCNPKKYTPDVIEEMATQLRSRVLELDDAGYNFWNVDEVHFRLSDYSEKAWA